MSETGVSIRLLGATQIERDGHPVRGFESRKALALVCYLAAAGRPVPRGRLADLFWSGRTEEQGRANLSRVLHNNAALLPGCVQATRADVAFDRAAQSRVDTVAFARLTAAGDPASLAAAADLYRGEFMDGVYLDGCPDFETWLVSEQETWRRRAADLFGRLIAGCAAAGDHDAALAYARRLLALDNWREEAHRQVMLLLALTGQRSAALAQYHQCRELLRAELGVEPGRQTRELYERIRAGQAAPPLAPPAAPRPDERKLAQVTARLERPECRLLVLAGGGPRAASLAERAARLRAASLRDGLIAAQLAAPVAAPGLAAALAHALRLPAGDAPDLPRRLFACLDDRELLLLIRGFEPREDAAALLGDILKRAPGVQILVTAARPLDVCGEWVVDVEG